MEISRERERGGERKRVENSGGILAVAASLLPKNRSSE
jgi:hypothetical protein